MHIVHYKHTGLAWAPEAIADVTNRYTEHTAEVVIAPRMIPPCDVVHFHNKVIPYYGPQLIQFHSEPDRVDLLGSEYKLVIAQYHATLPEYQDCHIVRNPVDFPDATIKAPTNRIRIGYSPSIKDRRNEYYDKGYERTVGILENIAASHPVEFDVIHGVPLAECLRRKATCNVIIDECVTGSYHRSALEGAAMGALTICYMKPEVVKVLMEACGGPSPFLNVKVDNLADILWSMADRGVEPLLEVGRETRRWFEEYWNPADIAAEYVKHYEAVS